MKLLLDTQLLLGAAGNPGAPAYWPRSLLKDLGKEPIFSAASLVQAAITQSFRRGDFRVEARLLRRGLNNGL